MDEETSSFHIRLTILVELLRGGLQLVLCQSGLCRYKVADGGVVQAVVGSGDSFLRNAQWQEVSLFPPPACPLLRILAPGAEEGPGLSIVHCEQRQVCLEDEGAKGEGLPVTGRGGVTWGGPAGRHCVRGGWVGVGTAFCSSLPSRWAQICSPGIWYVLFCLLL